MDAQNCLLLAFVLLRLMSKCRCTKTGTTVSARVFQTLSDVGFGGMGSKLPCFGHF